MNNLLFPSVKFCKIWQTGNKHFPFVGAHFSEKSIRRFFKVKDMYKNKINPAKPSPIFSRGKFVSRRIRCAVKILDDFTKEEGALGFSVSWVWLFFDFRVDCGLQIFCVSASGFCLFLLCPMWDSVSLRFEQQLILNSCKTPLKLLRGKCQKLNVTIGDHTA